MAFIIKFESSFELIPMAFGIKFESSFELWWADTYGDHHKVLK